MRQIKIHSRRELHRIEIDTFGVLELLYNESEDAIELHDRVCSEEDTLLCLIKCDWDDWVEQLNVILKKYDTKIIECSTKVIQINDLKDLEDVDLPHMKIIVPKLKSAKISGFDNKGYIVHNIGIHMGTIMKLKNDLGNDKEFHYSEHGLNNLNAFLFNHNYQIDLKKNIKVYDVQEIKTIRIDSLSELETIDISPLKMTTQIKTCSSGKKDVIGMWTECFLTITDTKGNEKEFQYSEYGLNDINHYLRDYGYYIKLSKKIKDIEDIFNWLKTKEGIEYNLYYDEYVKYFVIMRREDSYLLTRQEAEELLDAKISIKGIYEE